MSLERVLRTLEGFGLSRTECEVYVYLAKAGPSKAGDLTVSLGMTKQQLYPALKELREKGIVVKKPKRSLFLQAMVFEELLDLYVKLNIDKAQIIKETKEELLASWREATTNLSNT